MVDPHPTNDALIPSCRVSRVMAKPGATAVTVQDLHERLRSVRGLPTLWEALQRFFRLERDEIVVMPISLFHECEREAGPAPLCIKGIVGLRDVFILHHRSEGTGPSLLLEPAVRHVGPASCDACGAQSLTNFYSSRELRRTLCAPCYQLRTAPLAPSEAVIVPRSPGSMPITHESLGSSLSDTEQQRW